MQSVKRKLKVLDFDIETRPLSYWYSDRPTAEMTAICFGFDARTLETWVLGKDDKIRMLEAFVKAYDEAEMVTGHYIRRFDLPAIVVELAENGMKPIGEKLVQDTKMDYIRHGDQPATQEYLCEMLGIPLPKVHMTQGKWRNANRLTESGMQDTIERVEGDVKQHMMLREKMIENELLNPPRVWSP